jgi:hypothetical protein
MDNRRSLAAAWVFAGVGLAFGLPPILETPLCLPGYWVLKAMPAMYWGDGWGQLMVANLVVYGLVGYAIARVVRSWRPLLFATAIVIAVTASATTAVVCVRHRVDEQRLMSRLMQDCLLKLEQDPNDVCSLHWLGVHHLTRTRQLRDAQRYFLRVVDLNKADHSVELQRSLIYLAVIYQSTGDSGRAEEYHERFLASNPDLEQDNVLRHYDAEYRRRRRPR